MDCDEFLQGYSDYSDGLWTSEQLREYEAHLRRCPACAKYDRVVKQGIELFRNLPRPDASPDFLPRLRHRLYHVDDHSVLGARLGGGAALIAMAAVGLLALVWLPFAGRIPVEVELAPVAVAAPASAAAELPSLFSSGPFVMPVVYEVESVGARGVQPVMWGPWSGSQVLFGPVLAQTGSSSRSSSRASDPSR